MGSIAYVDSLALFKHLPAQLTLISISTEFVLRHVSTTYWRLVLRSEPIQLAALLPTRRCHCLC